MIPQNILGSNKRYYESCKPNRDCTTAQTVQNNGTRPSRMGCRTGLNTEVNKCEVMEILKKKFTRKKNMITGENKKKIVRPPKI